MAAPSRLVPLRSAHGQRLLYEATPSSHDLLGRHYLRQEHRKACGLATAAILLNTLSAGRCRQPELSEHSLGDLVAQHVDVDRVRDCGMTLQTFREVMLAAGAEVNCIHASNIGGGAEAMRSILTEALSGGAGIALNYHMSTLGQTPLGGHFSPVSAYHQGEDRFLVMDVWPDTEPVWAMSNDVWSSINTIDSESGAHRGISLVTLPVHS